MNPFHLLNKDLYKDLSFLMGGTFIAQLIPILLQPVLKRLFTVEEFGVFDIYFRSVGLLAIIFSLKYEKAIILCKSKSDSVSIYIGIIFLGLVSFIITELILFILGSFGVNILGIQEGYSLIVYLVPFSALFFSINLASQLMFIRQKRFMASSSLKIYRRASEGLIQSGSGFFGQFGGLPLGEAIGNFTAALAGMLRLRKELWSHMPTNLLASIKKNARNYSEFPKYAFISNLLNTFVLSALTFQIFAKFSIQEVGYAELTQRMLTGQRWDVSGIYAKSLILSASLLLIISPLGQILIALHKIKTNSYWELGKFLVIASLFLIEFESIGSYLKIYNLLLVLIYFSYLVIILTHIIKYEKSIS